MKSLSPKITFVVVLIYSLVAIEIFFGINPFQSSTLFGNSDKSRELLIAFNPFAPPSQSLSRTRRFYPREDIVNKEVRSIHDSRNYFPNDRIIQDIQRIERNSYLETNVFDQRKKRRKVDAKGAKKSGIMPLYDESLTKYDGRRYSQCVGNDCWCIRCSI